MHTDSSFWEELLAGLSYADLDWLQIRIERQKASLHPEIIARKTIIRKQED